MEHLARVRDGSEKVLANGYWTLSVIGAEVQKPSLVPLYGSLYSQRSPAFRSENVEIRWAQSAGSRRQPGTKGFGCWIEEETGEIFSIIC